MKTFTRTIVLSWQPCHGETETLRIMEGLPEQMNAIDVLRHDAATPADRLWCVIRPEVLSDRTMRLFAAWCARNVLDAERAAGREPDPRSWAAIEVAERYAVGKSTEDELRAARVAAYNVVCVAWAAAYNAACAGYACAAYDAARAAAYDAATEATAYAARAIATGATAARAAAAAAAADADAEAVRAAAYAAQCAGAYAAARAAQVARLIQLIEENEK